MEKYQVKEAFDRDCRVAAGQLHAQLRTLVSEDLTGYVASGARLLAV